MYSNNPASMPPIDKYNGPYWAGLRGNVLRVPKCKECGHLQFPMGPCCSACLSTDLEWTELSGRGKVWSFIVYHHAYAPHLADKLPYNVAEILLDDGVKLLSNVVGIPISEIRNDMPVKAVFDKISDELTLLRFEPADSLGQKEPADAVSSTVE